MDLFFYKKGKFCSIDFPENSKKIKRPVYGVKRENTNVFLTINSPEFCFLRFFHQSNRVKNILLHDGCFIIRISGILQ